MGFRVPRACLARKPTKQTVLFAGKFISLIAIAKTQGIHHSNVSRIFSGQREPSIRYVKLIARALGIGVEDFLAMLDAHLRQQRHLRLQAIAQQPPVEHAQ